jgi:hypothetical protein
MASEGNEKLAFSKLNPPVITVEAGRWRIRVFRKNYDGTRRVCHGATKIRFYLRFNRRARRTLVVPLTRADVILRAVFCSPPTFSTLSPNDHMHLEHSLRNTAKHQPHRERHERINISRYGCGYLHLRNDKGFLGSDDRGGMSRYRVTTA